MDIEKKALALVNGARSLCRTSILSDKMARDLANELERAIEQHEAFRREVSDALSVYQKADGVEERSRIWDALTRFIIPQPDPLVEAVKSCGYETLDAIEPEFAADLRAALAARGLEIVKKEPSQ